ncbi:TetR/AcrR family transcriptional regulator [Verrucomicrobia bacterium LW23]|nr:TetR/AcrR family transcriptional regulator [Verrucomicrobia bacterium LW23]
MARPKSNDKRRAILDAATRVIAAQGLSAPTATLAREAGISNGSLFTYFATKSELLNQLYVELKTEMAAALHGFPAEAPLREQVLYVWTNWMRWATTHPDKRRALALLAVSDDITPETRAVANRLMAGVTGLMERVRAGGPLREAPMPFVGAMLTSLAETTMDFMIHDPPNAAQHCAVGFETAWRAIG